MKLRRARLSPILFVLASCSLAFRQPEVRIVRVELGQLGLSGGTAGVEIEITNLNGYELHIRELHYRLELRDPEDDSPWRELSQGSDHYDLTIPARDQRVLEVEAPFRYDAVVEAAVTYLTGSVVEYRLRGDVRVGGPVGDVVVPFRSRGEFEP